MPIVRGCRNLLVAVVAIVAAAPLAGGPAAGPAEDADALFSAGNWAAAATAYESIAAKNPQAAMAWYRLGVSRHQMKQYDGALEAYGKAVSLQPAMRGVHYNMACALALRGRADEALAELEKALGTDFITPEQLRKDDDLASLRDRPEFAQVVDKADQKVRPCEHDPRARQFDFWVGDWEVYTPQGNRAGHNRITRSDNGCTLVEEWAGALGGTGRSLNFFDTQSGHWNQVWVDSTGGILRYEGDFHDGAIVMVGHPAGRNNGPIIRTTWAPLPDGRVRHASEITQDGGTTWQPRFELLYSKAE
jgi:hypothetical protein